jgi:HK97 family phage prohead protease
MRTVAKRISRLTTIRKVTMTKTDDEAVKLGEHCVASFDFKILKAEESDDGKRGQVTALVSAYDVEYRMGGFGRPIMHIIQLGAFANSLKSNSTIPLFWQHNWDLGERPPIGVASAHEEPRGLVIEGEFFLDTEDGRSVYHGIKAKALREWSIGYRILQAEVDDSDDSKRVVRVSDAELLEASSVLRGANPETDTLKVAQQIPQEIQEALDATAEFMQSQKEMNDHLKAYCDALASRLDGLEKAHDVLVDSFEEVVGVGSEVEPASGGGGDLEGARSSPEGETPSSADGVAAEGQVGDTPAPSPDPLDLDALEQTVTAKVVAKIVDLDALEQAVTAKVVAKIEDEVNKRRQEIADRAGRILPPGENDEIRDLESLTRVLRVSDKVKNIWESVERSAEAGVLAANRAMPVEEV